MSSISERYLQKATAVIEVIARDGVLDFHTSIQNREFIIGKIRSEDVEFAAVIEDNELLSFAYGDKYFYPHEKGYVCLPLRCEDPEAELVGFLPEEMVKIMKEYRGMIPLMEDSGYFDISQ